MKTEHTIGFIIIALLLADVYLEYLIYQELKGSKQ